MCNRETNPAQLRRLLPGRMQKSCFEGRFTERVLRAANTFHLDYTQYSRPIKTVAIFKMPLFAFSQVEKLLIMYVTGRGVCGEVA